MDSNPCTDYITDSNKRETNTSNTGSLRSQYCYPNAAEEYCVQTDKG